MVLRAFFPAAPRWVKTSVPAGTFDRARPYGRQPVERFAYPTFFNFGLASIPAASRISFDATAKTVS